MASCASTTGHKSATAAAARNKQHVSETSLRDRQRAAGIESQVLVVNAAVGVGASCGIAEISITDTTVKRLELRAIPKVSCWRRVILVIPNETLNRC
jgi:hypothetical protein